ncbi:hypothetical protein NL108_001020, partial [Boleophthalmus pectinirostris]
FRATLNPAVKRSVTLELSHVNSTLQLLRQELEELNSCMVPYQSESVNLPMIPLGLKETKELDFSLCIKDFISEIYGEESSEFESEIQDLNQLRQAVTSPLRCDSGLDLMLKYYNQLYFVDQRFCKPQSHMGALFLWYDSLTGVPSTQKSLAFEKGSVLFNLAALNSQIGARQNRTDPTGTETAATAFRRAAGAFLYLRENFCNAPSLDMSEPCLWTLQLLMTAQARECVHERSAHSYSPAHSPSHSPQTLQLLRLAQEAAAVSEQYLQAFVAMAQPVMKSFVPFSWSSMVQLKLQRFKSLSHFYCGRALEQSSELTLCLCRSDDDLEVLLQFYSHCPTTTSVLLRAPQGRQTLCKSHLRSAVMGLEESLRLFSSCKVLRKMDALREVLTSDHRRVLDRYSDLDQEDDFTETRDAPEIRPHSDHGPDPIPPDFSSVQVSDLFHRLGPLCVFSARSGWGPLRTLLVPQTRGSTLGLTLRGDAPVLVLTRTKPGLCLQEAGLREGDYIVSVNGVDTKWSKRRDVEELLRRGAGPGVAVGVVTLH